ncbi:metal-dependent hydrolase [Muriicola sp. Z0-33]|uniref:metal-dependent hydrolase n=1 Tax=Muriicola sp. Z0-33 TaxID=2816957 RepID=UPI0022385975|nr:metal-dependent hydrolase [Muriicola sp. Z0-33]MCW5517225.1 metal-dependent hydrolase [Muriicola sp. Z0-33]
MDSLTQIVLGAAVGEAVLGKKVGSKAALYGAIAGTIPDLDMLSAYFVDLVTYTEWHRGFSHSILFSLLMAPIFGWLISKIERKSGASYKDWSRLMFWGLFTHPLLDAFTTWGTQLFWPFDLRLAFQNIFVIDPLYTLPFLIFLIMALRQKRGSIKRRKYNNLGLIVSSGYLLVSLILKGIAYNRFVENLDIQGVSYQEIAIRPTAFNTILWTANIDAGDAYLIGDYSFFDSKPIKFKSYPKNHELLGNLKADDKVQRLIAISEGWYIITKAKSTIYFNDLRFGILSTDEKETKYIFSYLLLNKQNGLVVQEAPKFANDAKSLFAKLWIRIKGN